ncbi:unnamed protein product [Haemonchus placei]|uniref:Uncharacterized protein n=1 Tax=Haemonchus placei TaxID=6290 RepID=A0A3P7YV22_HAEPC|nr:unnamed protein product [Haemonchus placei]
MAQEEVPCDWITWNRLILVLSMLGGGGVVASGALYHTHGQGSESRIDARLAQPSLPFPRRR